MARCGRCGTRLASSSRNTLDVPLAMALTAFILFWPANFFPILTISEMGNSRSALIWDGVVALWGGGLEAVAILVFVCAILAPLAAILLLLYLLLPWKLKGQLPRRSAWSLRFLNKVDDWRMLDVYILAIFISYTKLVDLAQVEPGAGLFAFILLLATTMIAYFSFEPSELWDQVPPVHSHA